MPADGRAGISAQRTMLIIWQGLPSVACTGSAHAWCCQYYVLDRIHMLPRQRNACIASSCMLCYTYTEWLEDCKRCSTGMQAALKPPRAGGRLQWVVDAAGQQVAMDQLVQAERSMLCEVGLHAHAHVHACMLHEQMPWRYQGAQNYLDTYGTC